MGVNSLFSAGKLKTWPDVLDPTQDGKSAPALWEVVQGQAPEIYRDPEKFFERTHFSPTLRNTLEGVANRIQGVPEHNRKAASFRFPNVVMLASRFGGGKTHTLISLHHVFTQPNSARHADEKIATSIARIKDVQVVSLDADSRKLVPHPLEPYTHENFRIATIWGMLAYRLGEYGKIRHLDGGEKPVPDTNTLKDLLSGKKVLILMDEIVKYAFNMQRSAETKNYGEKVITFVENLARAVEDTDSILVIAVQADYKKGAESAAPISISDFTPDHQYRQQAEDIIAALRRVSPAIVTPVSYDDIAQVLKKRIFEKIPDDASGEAQSEFYAIYRNHQSLFGPEGRWDFATTSKILSTKDTYPFHPKYVEVLSDFVTRNKELQRTRDAVNITRKVVRNLLRGDSDPIAVMAWHIDLKNREIRDNTITESYSKDFDSIVNRDIVSREGKLGNVRRCLKPEIAAAIANTVLLKTFTYETFKAALNVFPDLTDVALMAYEPEIFTRFEATPPDIQDLLKEMTAQLEYFVGDKGRFWFSPFRSVIEIVDKMAESLVREDKPKLFRDIEEIARGIVKASLSKASGEYEPLVFKDCKVFFVRPGLSVKDVSIPDDEKMKLVVFLKEARESEVEDAILMSEMGQRLRKNTIVAIYPDPNRKLDDLLLFAARINAAEQVTGNLREYYADQDVRSLQQKKLNNYIELNHRHVMDGLLSTLNKVAYPTTGPSVKIVSAHTAPSLVEQVERALNSAGAGYKIRERIGFDDLAGYLKNSFNIDIVEGEKAVDFRYIIDDLFLAKPEGPFVAKNQIEEAIRQGLRNFDIAVKQEGKIYWKKVNSEEIEEPESLSDRAEILPYKLAARDTVSSFLREEGRKKTAEGHIIETRYYVKILDEEKPLSAIISQSGFERVLKQNLILRRETRIEKGFDVALEKTYVTLKLGEHINTKFTVEPIGEFSDPVEIETAFGTTRPSMGNPPFAGVWDIGTLDRAGTYRFSLTAKSGRLSRPFELTALVESQIAIKEVESLDLSSSGSMLAEIRPYTISSFKVATDILDKLGLEAKARGKVTINDKISFEVTESNPSMCDFLLQRFQEFKDRFSPLVEKFDYFGALEISKPRALDQKAIANLQPLNKKAKFVVQVPR